MFNFSFVNNNNLTKVNYIFFIFVLCSLVYNNDITAFDKTNVDDFQNSSSKNFKQNYDSRMINYPNSNITNLTNNNEDSIYGQIESFENNIYVVWQESVTETLPEHNYDIYFIKSEDNGKTFSDPINLSNSTEFSERPQIAVSKNGIFIVWADNTNSNNTEIMFTKSLDNGTTFSEVRNLSNSSKNSNNQEISVSDENVYVVWQDIDKIYSHSNKKVLTDKEISSSIIFRGSTNNGDTFTDKM